MKPLDLISNRGALTELLGLREPPSAMGSDLPAVIGIFAAGMVAGAALALLLAPAPGREVRARLGERLGELRERAGLEGAGQGA